MKKNKEKRAFDSKKKERSSFFALTENFLTVAFMVSNNSNNLF